MDIIEGLEGSRGGGDGGDDEHFAGDQGVHPFPEFGDEFVICD